MVERVPPPRNDLAVPGARVTFGSFEDAVRARSVIPQGKTFRSLGRGLVADPEMLAAFGQADIDVYPFREPGRRLPKPLNLNMVIARLEKIP